MIEYKGYIGAVNFDSEINLFHGTVIIVNPENICTHKIWYFRTRWRGFLTSPICWCPNNCGLYYKRQLRLTLLTFMVLLAHFLRAIANNYPKSL